MLLIEPIVYWWRQRWSNSDINQCIIITALSADKGRYAELWSDLTWSGSWERHPWRLSGWRIQLQCRRYRRHGFCPWVRKIPWKRKWQPTPVFLPGKYHGQRSLAGSGPWDHKGLDMTEVTEHPLGPRAWTIWTPLPLAEDDKMFLPEQGLQLWLI